MELEDEQPGLTLLVFSQHLLDTEQKVALLGAGKQGEGLGSCSCLFDTMCSFAVLIHKDY